MSTRYLLRHLAFGLSMAVVALGCGGSKDSPTDSTGGGSAGAPGASQPSFTQVCSAACSRAGTCFGDETYDEKGCNSRCVVEMSGNGTLDPKAAAAIFGRFANASSCAETQVASDVAPVGWGGYYEQRAEICGAVQTECEAAVVERCGSKISSPSGLCFRTVCISSAKIRAPLLACWHDKPTCDDASECRAPLEAQLSGDPWWGQAAGK